MAKQKEADLFQVGIFYKTKAKDDIERFVNGNASGITIHTTEDLEIPSPIGLIPATFAQGFGSDDGVTSLQEKLAKATSIDTGKVLFSASPLYPQITVPDARIPNDPKKRLQEKILDKN